MTLKNNVDYARDLLMQQSSATNHQLMDYMASLGLTIARNSANTALNQLVVRGEATRAQLKNDKATNNKLGNIYMPTELINTQPKFFSRRKQSKIEPNAVTPDGVLMLQSIMANISRVNQGQLCA